MEGAVTARFLLFCIEIQSKYKYKKQDNSCWPKVTH